MKYYIMLDLETTSLDTLTAHPVEIGMVVFTPFFEPLESFEATLPRPADQWDQGTLEWAANLYSKGRLDLLVGAGHSDFDRVGFRIQALEGFGRWVEEWTRRAGGAKNLHVVVNHPEFDIPILRRALGHYGFTYPFHYQNHLDCKSLIIGANGWSALDAIKRDRARIRVAKEEPKHEALADCYSQIRWLKNLGVKLP